MRRRTYTYRYGLVFTSFFYSLLLVVSGVVSVANESNDNGNSNNNQENVYILCHL